MKGCLAARVHLVLMATLNANFINLKMFYLLHTRGGTQYYHQAAYYCMPPDDGCMTETCCGNNIRRGEKELLR
jgi:hypothetical protein